MIYRVLNIALGSLALAGSLAVAQTLPRAVPVKPSTTVRAAIKPVNVNTASEAQLMTLPGIGPKTARQIIRHRPFRDAADFQARLSRIGPREWARIEKYVLFK